jgi:heme exporter protein D
VNLSDFFHMGGYAFYVWTSYALAAVVLVANLLAPLVAGRRARRELIGTLKRGGKL